MNLITVALREKRLNVHVSHHDSFISRYGLNFGSTKDKSNQTKIPSCVSCLVPQTLISAPLNACCAGASGICTRNICIQIQRPDYQATPKRFPSFVDF